MKFKADEIASVIQQEIEQFQTQVDVREVGRVLEVSDGIARVYGLSDVMAGEMVEFSDGVSGLAFNLEENSVGVIILGDYLKINEGDEVQSTGQLLSVPVGDALLGRVVDPLGNPLDGKGPINTTETRPVEVIATGVAERQPVKESLQTGIKAIDAMTPIGRGQRELIIGDRKTGKTAICIDTIINQKGKGVSVLLRCGWSERIDRRRDHRNAPQAWRDGIHHGDPRRCVGPCPASVHRVLRRLCHGRTLHVQRRTRLDRVRRSFQTSPGVSSALAFDASTART